MTNDPHDLSKNPANFVALTPITLLRKAAAVYPDHTAVVYGAIRRTWRETADRCRRLASALERAGLKPGETVSVLATNTPELYEAHFGVPLAGGILNALNCRLDAKTIAWILDHCEARFLITDREFSETANAALDLVERRPVVIDIDDAAVTGGELLGKLDYEAFIATGDADHPWRLPEDEWDAISINYTSGTTGDPKGVVYHHRGAWMNAVGNTMEWDMGRHPVYLWTLPMFHCNGWCFPWTIAAKAGTNVCCRKVTASVIYDAIADEGVDHLCGAPVVLGFMINARADEIREFSHRCRVMTAASPPPASVLQKMAAQGFEVTHVYGLTEVYGPAIACAWHREWNDLDPEEQARLKSRQGVAYLLQEDAIVADPETLEPVPWDGETLGEVLMRGNITMKGYLKSPDATREAFAGGWFHSGDLGVMHPDGYMELKDRSKDIIISGGENISSIEIENVLMSHPDVTVVAVVAKPHEKWGETPCAFVELRDGATVTGEELIAWCRDRLAHYKAPKHVVFQQIERTPTGKIQKGPLRTQAAGL